MKSKSENRLIEKFTIFLAVIFAGVIIASSAMGEWFVALIFGSFLTISLIILVFKDKITKLIFSTPYLMFQMETTQNETMADLGKKIKKMNRNIEEIRTENRERV